MKKIKNVEKIFILHMLASPQKIHHFWAIFGHFYPISHGATKLKSAPCINVFIFSAACAIELQHTVVVTGGWNSGGWYGRAIATVQVYTISGPQEQLPDLMTGRWGHACAHFVDSENIVVSTPSM